MTTWSRKKKYATEIALLQAKLTKTYEQLTAEITHSGRLHNDLVTLQDAVDSGEHVKRLTERLHQFTEASVDADRAVHEALAEHRNTHVCKPRPDVAPAGGAA